MNHPVPATIAHGTVRPWHILLLHAMTFCVVVVAGHYLFRSVDSSLRGVMGTALLHVASCALLLFIVVCIADLRRAIPELFRRSTTPVAPTDVLILVALMVCWGTGLHAILFYFPIASFISNGYDWLQMAAKREILYPQFIIILAIATILAPLGEELIFRGLLLNMWRAKHGTWVGIALSSAVFGLFHWQYATFAVGSGAIFALVYLRHGSLVAPILIHALCNLVMITTGLGDWPIIKNRQTVDQLSSWSLEIALSLAFFPLAYLFWRRYKPQ